MVDCNNIQIAFLQILVGTLLVGWSVTVKKYPVQTGLKEGKFTEGQIRELRAIYHLVKEGGFTLAGAKARLKTQNNREVEFIYLKGAIRQLRNKRVIW